MSTSCTKCGARNDDTSRVCSSCGAPIAPGHKWGLTIGVTAGTIAILAIVAAIALPAYQEHRLRATISVAVDGTSEARTAVETYYARNKVFPRRLDEAGVAPLPADETIKSIRIDPGSGVIEVHIGHLALEQRPVLLVPSVGEGGRISWKCDSRYIPGIYLPRQCR
ncbi:MAG: pilin [Betaproteobacteria bacterium]|nr:pilin [Betaproteobacteria bacterium]